MLDRIVPGIRGRESHGRRQDPLPDYEHFQDRGSEQVMRIQLIQVVVFGVFQKEGPLDWYATQRCLDRAIIGIGHKSVMFEDIVANLMFNSGIGPWLGRVSVFSPGMYHETRLKNGGLTAARQELFGRRVPEESPQVVTVKGQAAQAEGQAHILIELQGLPIAAIVAGPGAGISLQARISRARVYPRPRFGIVFLENLVGRFGHFDWIQLLGPVRGKFGFFQLQFVVVVPDSRTTML
ncbi:hypothetical protein SDC9_97992 [bioreactor metagenome]|uniref:Uncharacterized protein n=1 Tax=bioreactor metagenome TaxID=1076179 RepID=A0A645ANR1_9ZZZZ